MNIVLVLFFCSCELCTAFLSLSSLHRLHGGARPPRTTYVPQTTQTIDVFFEEHDQDSDAVTSIRSKILIHHTHHPHYSSQNLTHPLTHPTPSTHPNSGTDEKGVFVTRRPYDSHGVTGPLKLLTPLMLLWEEGPGNILSQLFLPTGFAPKELKEYLHYQRWNLLQDACSYLRGIMGTQVCLSLLNCLQTVTTV